METKTKVRLIIGGILAVLALIVIIQNSSTVATKFLFVTVNMPQIVLLVITLAIGFAGGFIVAGIRNSRKKG